MISTVIKKTLPVPISVLKRSCNLVINADTISIPSKATLKTQKIHLKCYIFTKIILNILKRRIVTF